MVNMIYALSTEFNVKIKKNKNKKNTFIDFIGIHQSLNRPSTMSAPLSKTQYLHFRFHASTFFYLRRFLKKLADDQCSLITKAVSTMWNIMYIQPFTTVVDWPEIGCLMEVSTVFHICRYCVFTWDGRPCAVYL